MPFCPCDDRPSRARTRLETSLLQLDRALRENARAGDAVDSMFLEWQSRWANRRGEIVRRLEAIDSQLDGFASSNPAALRLAVVGVAEEGARPSAAKEGT